MPKLASPVCRPGTADRLAEVCTKVDIGVIEATAIRVTVRVAIAMINPPSSVRLTALRPQKFG